MSKFAVLLSNLGGNLKHGIGVGGRDLSDAVGAISTHPTQQIVLREYMDVTSERMLRLERMDNELTITPKKWRFYPVVRAFQAMRGARLLSASGVVAELGDLQSTTDRL